MMLLGYVAIVGIGIVLGSMGAGGSMLALPVLVYVFDVDVETASAYSLFLVGITSVSGVLLKRGQQQASFRTTLWFGIPSLTGAFIGRKWFIVMIPDPVWQSDWLLISKDHLLLGLFAFFMMASATKMLTKKSDQSAGALPRRWKLVAVGFAVGMISAVVGAGGGFLIVPALVLFAGIRFQVAAATSLLLIATNCLVAFSGDIMNRSIDWLFLLPLTSLAVIGMFAGIRWQSNTRTKMSWNHAFAWFTMFMGLTILVSETVL